MFKKLLQRFLETLPFEVRKKPCTRKNPEKPGTSENNTETTDNEDLGDYENLEPPTPWVLLDEDLDNLALLMPTVNEAWERAERMTDEEIITIFSQCNPISQQDSKMTLGMNLAHRFIQDHMGIKRPHQKKPRSRKRPGSPES